VLHTLYQPSAYWDNNNAGILLTENASENDPEMTSLNKKKNPTLYGVILHREHDPRAGHFTALVKTNTDTIYIVKDKPEEEPFALAHTISFNPGFKKERHEDRDYPLAVNAKLHTAPLPLDKAPHLNASATTIDYSRAGRKGPPDRIVFQLHEIPGYEPQGRTWKLDKNSVEVETHTEYSIYTKTEKKPSADGSRNIFYLHIYCVKLNPHNIPQAHKNVIPTHFAQSNHWPKRRTSNS
jgi:hypothetical protein